MKRARKPSNTELMIKFFANLVITDVRRIFYKIFPNSKL